MSRQSAKVLIVDNERYFREAIAEILKAAGRDCIQCADPDLALGFAEDPSIGVVLLDMAMPSARRRREQGREDPSVEGPGEDRVSPGGLELLEELLAVAPDTRVIMLSAENDAERVLHALRLGACDHLAKPLHDEELLLCVARAMATHTALADRLRLRDRLGRLATAVEELARRMAAARGSDRSRLLSRGAAEVAAEVLEASKTSLMLLDKEGTALHVAANVGGNLAPEQMEPSPIGEGVAGLALQCSGGIVVEDIAIDGRFVRGEFADRYDSESFAVVPLAAEGQLLGVLCATDRVGGDRFEEEDLALLRLLALHVAEFMADEARATGVTGRQHEGEGGFPSDLPAAEDYPYAAEDAELVREVCDAVVAEVEPARVVRAALAPLARGLNAAPVSLFLVDPDTGELQMEGECDCGLRGDRADLVATRGLTGTVFQTGQLVAAPDPQVDPRFDASVDTAEDGVVRPLLCVPLKLRGKTVGLFRAFPEDRQRVSARTGELIAASLSAAIRSVLLYRSLLATIEEVAQVRRQVH